MKTVSQVLNFQIESESHQSNEKFLFETQFSGGLLIARVIGAQVVDGVEKGPSVEATAAIALPSE